MKSWLGVVSEEHVKKAAPDRFAQVCQIELTEENFNILLRRLLEKA